MAENKEINGTALDTQMEIKVEPATQYYTEEDAGNNIVAFETIATLPPPADVGTMNLWTSKATTCLITQYKKYHMMVGQSTQIRNLREMFEMISIEMQKCGFFFSPQKCENKWRVLERKYRNLVFREILKKPGRMRHYGHWEHKRALDEIFKDKKRHMYLEESDVSKYAHVLQKPEEQSNSAYNPAEDGSCNSIPMFNNIGKKSEENERALVTVLEKYLEEIKRNFALAERNNERRHKEEMAIRQRELEVQQKLAKLKEQKMELQKCQMIAAAQHLHLNMQ